MSIKEKTAAVRQAEQEWEAIPDGRQAADALHKYTSAVKDLLAELDKPTDDELYQQAMAEVTPEALERMDKVLNDINARLALLNKDELGKEEVRRIYARFWPDLGRNNQPEAPKVLTDEDVERETSDYMVEWIKSGARNLEGREAFADGLRRGASLYIAPAAGLTVEEVELKGNDYDCLLQCTGCNWRIGWHIEEDLEPMKFCPGCGNKIKR